MEKYIESNSTKIDKNLLEMGNIVAMGQINS